jgi:hypothetical protein
MPDVPVCSFPRAEPVPVRLVFAGRPATVRPYPPCFCFDDILRDALKDASEVAFNAAFNAANSYAS